MEDSIVIPTQIDLAVREWYYHLIGQVPESEAAWQERQVTLRTWRSDSRFKAYWPSIDHMLSDNFVSFRHRVSAIKDAFVPLEDYDFDAWREQREYDLKHANDHLP